MTIAGPIASATVRDYEVFGLRVRSALDLPELFSAEGSAEADIVIRSGAIDLPPSAPGVEPAAGGLLLTIPEVGRFLIREGRSIDVEPRYGIDPRNVRLYLLGSAFGVLLHQRGLLPLHANAVEIDGKAIAFMGASGAGKSTLAAWFHDQGCRVVADDVCLIGFDSAGHPTALPGLPRIRLWRDALQRSGRSHSAHPLSYPLDETYEKHDVQLEQRAAVRGPLALGAVYVLERGDSFDIGELKASTAVEALFEQTYRGEFVRRAQSAEEHY